MTRLQVTHVSSITFVKHTETGEWEMRRNPEFVSTYETLTVAQLEQASHDLANASKVARYAGHATGVILDRITGGVCLVGAVEVATYKEIYTNDVGEFFDFTCEEWVEEGVDRADAALLVLSQTVQSGLCEACPTDRHAIETFPYAKVTHFSDLHCLGSQHSARMLDLASLVAAEEAARRTLQAVPLPRQSAEACEVIVA